MTTSQAPGAPVLLRFEPEDPACAALLQELGAANPFCTAAYAQALSALGREVWVLAFLQDGILHGALGAIRRGRLGASLEIPSLPGADPVSGFRDLVGRLCRERRVTSVYAESFGSPPDMLAAWPGARLQSARREFVLSLAGGTELKLSHRHQRSVKKAAAAGTEVVRVPGLAGLAAHMEAVRLSTSRRTARGENISLLSELECKAYLESGAGELLQAHSGGDVISSVLVLLSPRTAYYHSAGTSPAGMRVGASAFLITRAAAILRQAGMETFNLGGAPPGSTLAGFKSEFGAESVDLRRFEISFGPRWLRILRAAVRRLRS